MATFVLQIDFVIVYLLSDAQLVMPVNQLQ